MQHLATLEADILPKTDNAYETKNWIYPLLWLGINH